MRALLLFPTPRPALAGPRVLCLLTLGLLAGCDDGPGRSRWTDGPVPDGPPEPAFHDARHDGTFVTEVGGAGPGVWPTGPVPAPWTVSRVPAISVTPPVDAAAPPRPDAGTDGPQDLAGDDAPGADADRASTDADLDAGPDAGAGTDLASDHPPDLSPDVVDLLPSDLAADPPPILGQLGARASGDSFALTSDGRGLPITAARDDFLFVHRPLAGDGAIVALARTTAGCSTGQIEVGVMMRSSTGDDASYGMAAVTGAGGGVTLMSRASTGWYSNVLRFDGAPPLPVWLKVERNGNRLRLGYSRDGRGWTEAERDLLDAPLVLEAGLVAAAHGGTCTVLFERVALLGASAQAP